MSTSTDPVTAGRDAPAGAGPAAAPLRYRLLSGPDDRTFCERVSAALAEGYVLYGDPAVTFDGTRVIVAQAVVLDQSAAAAAVPA